MDVRKALAELSANTAPSGFECNVAEACAKLLEPNVDEIYIDHMYNVVGIKRCGKKNAKKLMLCAHIDEIGLMVTGHDKGFLKICNIGGVDRRMLPGREVTVLADKKYFGVVGTAAPHGAAKGDEDKALAVEDLRVDVGLTEKEVEKLIPVGTPISFRTPFFDLGEDFFCGKSTDDRACFVAMAYAAEILKDKQVPWDIYYVGTISEEIGLRGAKETVYSIQPDVAIATDVCQATTPDIHPWNHLANIGEGPRFCCGPHINKLVYKQVVKLAEEKRLPLSLGVLAGSTGTDCSALQIANAGIATAVISLPLQYMHTPQEVGSYTDLKLLGEIMAAYAEEPGEEARKCLNI